MVECLLYRCRREPYKDRIEIRQGTLDMLVLRTLQWVPSIVMKWLPWTERKRRERELDDELEAHFALEIQQRVEAGAKREEAAFGARRDFGNIGRVKEVTRGMWNWASLERIGQDLRYALRLFAREPGFAATVIIVLALGMSATTALFSVVDAVLLRPLPYRDPQRLAVLWTDDARKQIHESLVSYPNYKDWERRNTAFDDLAFSTTGAATISGGAIPERIDIAACSANLFSLFGVSPVLGRPFSAPESESGQAVAVISYGLWQRRFGGSRDAIGKRIQVDERDVIVIGVLPSSFAFPSNTTDMWQPLSAVRNWTKIKTERQRPLGVVVGRLKEGVTFSEAQANLNVIGAQLARQSPELANNPDFPGFHVRVISLPEQIRGRSVRTQWWVLLSAVGLVLLIACVNVANLLIAKSSARQRELAIRKALGASRSRLLVQLLVESVSLSLLSGIAGAALSPVAIRALVHIAPHSLMHVENAALNFRVLLFAFGLSILSGIIFGIAPALQTSKITANEALKTGGRGGTSTKAAGHLRAFLVTSEIALAVLLLCGAGLLFKSFLRLQEVPLGFQPDRVLAFRTVLPASMNDARQSMFYEQALERIRHIPGVASGGAISNLFISSSPDTTIVVEGRPNSAFGGEQVADDVVTPGFFRSLKVPLKEGRLFSEHDGRDSKHVAIINETFAKRFWPGVSPIGKRLQFGDGRFSDPWVRVIGVVTDMRRNGLENQSISQVFLPLAQLPSRGADIVIRTAGDPDAIASVVRRAMAEVDSAVPVYRLSTLDQRIAETIAPRRFQTFLFGLFAFAAVLLAAIGIYGLAHYTVLRRTPEFGVRMALGATSLEVVQLVIQQNLRLTVIGLALGTFGALLLTRALKSLLFDVSITDPITFVLAPLFLMVIVTIACARPAWQATKIDPVTALRYE